MPATNAALLENARLRAGLRDSTSTLGITSVRDRIAAVGGELTIRSLPGAGATVNGYVPSRARVGPKRRY